MKIKLYYLYLGLFTLCSILLFAARNVEGNFLLELIVSFLPLITLGLAGLFVISIIWTALYFEKLPKRMRLAQSIIIGSILFINLTSLMLSVIQVTTSLDNTVLAHERDLEKASTYEVHVAFYNKYFYNYNYSPIIKTVDDNFIDILGMAELSEESYQDIKSHISLPYSYYTNCHCHSMLGDPIALFSRYPLEDIHTDSFIDSGIIEATAIINDQTKLKVIVVHPDAPLNQQYLARRNQLVQGIDTVMQKYREQKVVLMGDFNLSSWSPTFHRLLTDNTFLKDAARGFGLLTTWGPYLIRTKIDHMLVSQNIAVKDFSTQALEGSDHEMIMARLEL